MTTNQWGAHNAPRLNIERRKTMWIALAILAAISLILYRRGQKSVWGGMTLGGIGGLIVAIVLALLGRGFHLSTIGKGMVVGVLLGILAELFGNLSGRTKNLKEQ